MKDNITVTLSGCTGIKQFSVPKSIKKILLVSFVGILLLVGLTFYYMQKMNKNIHFLEKENEKYVLLQKEYDSMKLSYEKKSVALEKKVELTISNLNLEAKRLEDEKQKRIAKNIEKLQLAKQLNEERKKKAEKKKVDNKKSKKKSEKKK